jgi:lysophospholipid acyltransferase (LPLAT)-like uncharacterized protein
MAIHALWHAQLLPLALRHRNENVAVIVSRHRDGERGGAAALRELARAASEGHPLSITTDGPRGPARQCKPGVIQAASITGLPIVPCAAAPVRTWIFRGWDDFLMPKPGTVVYIAYGQPIEIPPQVSREAFPEWQRRVTRALDEATRACTEAAGGTGGSADR